MGKIINADFTVNGIIKRAQNKINNGKIVEAISYLWQANKIDCTDANVLVELGNAYATLEIYERALKSYFTALHFDSKNENAYMGIVNIYIQLDRKDMAIIYMNMGINNGALSIDYEGDIRAIDSAINTEKIIEKNSNRKKRFSVINKLDRAYAIECAKKFIAEDEKELAKSILQDIPEQSKQYYEAMKILIGLYFTDYENAKLLPLLDKYLERYPNDILVLSIAIAGYYRSCKIAKMNDCVDRIEKKKITQGSDLFRLGIIFDEIGSKHKSVKYFQQALNVNPYDLETALCCAISNYNIDKRSYASELITNLRKLYPQEMAVKYYAGLIKNGKQRNIILNVEVPKGEIVQWLKDIDKMLSTFGNIEEVEKELEQDIELSEIIEWVLRYSGLAFASHVAEFLCQSKKWRVIIQDILLEPLVSIALKKDYLTAFLKYNEEKKYSLIVGDIFQTHIVHKPQVKDTEFLRACYYETYATMSFVTIDFENKLNEAYKVLFDVIRKNKMTKKNLPHSGVLCAILCHISATHRLFLDRVACCEIFDADINKMEEYIEKLELSKYSSVRKVDYKKGETNDRF